MPSIDIQRTIREFISLHVGRSHCSSALCYSNSPLVNPRFLRPHVAFPIWQNVRQGFLLDRLSCPLMFRYATDGTIAMFVGALPLIIPNKNPFQSNVELREEKSEGRNLENWEYQPILPWDYVSETFPWNVFFLQGAGLAIADGFKVIRPPVSTH